jgi:hypothetical protein
LVVLLHAVLDELTCFSIAFAKRQPKAGEHAKHFVGDQHLPVTANPGTNPNGGDFEA